MRAHRNDSLLARYDAQEGNSDVRPFAKGRHYSLGGVGYDFDLVDGISRRETALTVKCSCLTADCPSSHHFHGELSPVLAIRGNEHVPAKYEEKVMVVLTLAVQVLTLLVDAANSKAHRLQKGAYRLFFEMPRFYAARPLHHDLE